MSEDNTRATSLELIGELGAILHTQCVEVELDKGKNEIRCVASEPKTCDLSTIVSEDRTKVETFTIHDLERNVRFVVTAEDVISVLKAAIDMVVKRPVEVEADSE